MGKNNIKDRSSYGFFSSVATSSITFKNWLRKAQNVALGRFRWVGFPDTFDGEFLERCLFEDGHCTVFRDDVVGLVVMRSALTSGFDTSNRPTRSHCYSNGSGYTFEGNAENSVIAWNDFTGTPTQWAAWETALIMTDLTMSAIVNCRAQKTPVALVGDQDTVFSLRQAFQQIDGNRPAVAVDKKLLDKVQVLSTGAPFTAPGLQEIKNQFWHEYLDTLGIPNVTESKKERQFSEEIRRDMGGTFASRTPGILARETACKKINAMFGTNGRVEWMPTERREEDGNIYGGSRQDGAYSDGKE